MRAVGSTAGDGLPPLASFGTAGDEAGVLPARRCASPACAPPEGAAAPAKAAALCDAAPLRRLRGALQRRVLLVFCALLSSLAVAAVGWARGCQCRA
jgi:hypothetical protein